MKIAHLPELDKRIRGILEGTEKFAGFQDPLIKRSFAAFMNTHDILDAGFGKRIEGGGASFLMRSFYSSAVEEIRRAETWEGLEDTYAQLFVKLMSSIMN